MAHYLKGQTVTMTDDISLFDGLEIPKPPMIRPDDTARARRSDPIESHQAADRSAHTLSKLRLAVLTLVREEPLSIGSELNSLYRLRFDRRGWPKAAYDSPRKRSGELAEDGLLIIAGSRDGERMFIISEAGLKVVTS